MSDVNCDSATQGWPRRRLTDLIELPRGQVNPRDEPYRHWPLIAPDHVEPGSGRLLEFRSAEEQRAISGKYRVAPNDIILSKIRPALRKVARVDVDALSSADMYPLRPGPEIYSGFLFRLLLSEDFSRFVESRAGRSGIPKINRSELGEYTFHLPSRREQRRIAEILDSADEEIAAERHSLEKLTTLPLALSRSQLGLDSMASGRFEHRLDDVLLSIQSGRSPGLPDVPADQGEWGVLKVSAVQPRGLNHTENKAVRNRSLIDESIEVKQGDLLMTRANTDDLIGLSCIAEDPPQGLMLCDKTLRLDVNPELTIPEFVNLVLGLGEVRNQIRAMASGTSGSMKNISQDSIRELRIPLPALDVQQRLLGAVGACESKISDVRQRLDKLQLIKKGLMDDLLTGKVRVGDSGWSPMLTVHSRTKGSEDTRL